MTESFILMALGIGIGYSITLWLHRPRATTVAAMGPNTDMQSVVHVAASTEGSKIGSVVSFGEVNVGWVKAERYPPTRRPEGRLLLAQGDALRASGWRLTA